MLSVTIKAIARVPNLLRKTVGEAMSKESSFYPNGTTKTFCI